MGRMAGWIEGSNQFTINSSQDRRKAAGTLMEWRGVRLNATEIGEDRVREALDEPVKMPCVWHYTESRSTSTPATPGLGNPRSMNRSFHRS